MSLDHTTIEELLAVQALGGLDGDDIEVLARERATHGDCDECRRLEDGFAETAGRLAFSLDAEPVGAGMVERILGAPAGPASRTDPAPEADDLSRHRERRGVRGWQAFAAIAAAIALVVVAASVLRPGMTQVNSASPSQQIVRFEGEGLGDAGLTMAYTPGRAGAVFWGSNMPELSEDQVYEIWMIQDGTPVGGGCVSPQDGTIAVSVDADIGTTELMAVTVEDAACPSAPTTVPIMTADLA
jgi:Anti-sigma-K factor rskA, C-terminal